MIKAIIDGNWKYNNSIARFLAVIGWAGLFVVVITLIQPELLYIAPAPNDKTSIFGVIINLLKAAIIIGASSSIGAILEERFEKAIDLEYVVKTLCLTVASAMIGCILQLIPHGTFYVLLAIGRTPILAALFFLILMCAGLLVSIIGSKYSVLAFLVGMLLAISFGPPLIFFAAAKHESIMIDVLQNWYGLTIWPAIVLHIMAATKPIK